MGDKPPGMPAIRIASPIRQAALFHQVASKTDNQTLGWRSCPVLTGRSHLRLPQQREQPMPGRSLEESLSGPRTVSPETIQDHLGQITETTTCPREPTAQVDHVLQMISDGFKAIALFLKFGGVG
jgi:hypothetical protein